MVFFLFFFSIPIVCLSFAYFLFYERINTVNSIDANNFHKYWEQQKAHAIFWNIFRLKYRNSSLKRNYAHNQASNRIFPLPIFLQLLNITQVAPIWKHSSLSY